jgi:prepilin-type N-terminal cleavage/methylation domain-containing protein
MAQKYTILKVLIRNSNKGFTLLELLVGLIIMSVVGGMAMSAFVNTSASFQKDKKNIDSNQNLSAVLDIIGTDIRQAGEGINDGNFPVIEFSLDPFNTTANTAANAINPQASSRITIRKAVAPSLTLCETIAANVSTLPTTLIVADSTITTPVNVCNPGTLVTLGSGATAITRPTALLTAREYRCQLDKPDSNYATTATDLCAGTKPSIPSSDKEQVRAAISDGSGHIRTFNYSDDNVVTASSKYSISVGNNDSTVKTGDNSLGGSTMLNDARNKAVVYPIGSPIYLIEEKVYALSNDGNLTLSINGGPAETLITKISQFNISARLYTNALDQAVNPTPTVPATTAASGTTPATTTIAASAFVCPNQPDTSSTPPVSITNPQYICQFNYNTRTTAPITALVTDVAMNWKTIAGVKVSLQAKYDGTGQSASATSVATNEREKLSAAAEYFPRNVLSK